MIVFCISFTPFSSTTPFFCLLLVLLRIHSSSLPSLPFPPSFFLLRLSSLPSSPSGSLSPFFSSFSSYLIPSLSFSSFLLLFLLLCSHPPPPPSLTSSHILSSLLFSSSSFLLLLLFFLLLPLTPILHLPLPLLLLSALLSTAVCVFCCQSRSVAVGLTESAE